MRENRSSKWWLVHLTPRQWKRLFRLLGLMGIVGLGLGFMALSFESSLIYFYTPSQLLAKHHASPATAVGDMADTVVRVGGIVQLGSYKKNDRGVHTFVLRDFPTDQPEAPAPSEEEPPIITVVFDGVLPALFREGQGIVIIGKLQGFSQEKGGVVVAQEVLAKHDESYRPPGVDQSRISSPRSPNTEKGHILQGAERV